LLRFTFRILSRATEVGISLTVFFDSLAGFV